MNTLIKSQIARYERGNRTNTLALPPHRRNTIPQNPRRPPSKNIKTQKFIKAINKVAMNISIFQNILLYL